MGRSGWEERVGKKGKGGGGGGGKLYCRQRRREQKGYIPVTYEYCTVRKEG